MEINQELANPGTPWPSIDGRPVLFLLHARSGFESKLLEEWIESTRPTESDNGCRSYSVAHIPTISKRRKGLPQALAQAVNTAEDVWLAPLRVSWFVEAGGEIRAVRLRDLLFGDPRKPGPLRQRWLNWRHTGRMKLIVAEPATSGDLRKRFDESGESDFSLYPQYVIRQAILALERIERRIRGVRYKIPRLVDEDIMARPSFREELRKLAKQQNKSFASVEKEARRYLAEMAVAHSTLGLDLFAQYCRFMYTRGYDKDLWYDPEALENIREQIAGNPVVFLFTHKSHLDSVVLLRLLYDTNFPPLHLFGGINMKMFGLGELMRRAGVIFIRRSFKGNDVYKAVFQHYIDYLVDKRFPLTWAIEGTRSRTGKLMPPRIGLLSYVMESCQRMDAPDIMLVPVSIAYDQIPEVSELSAYQRGAKKKPEGVAWMMRYLTGLKNPFGRIFGCFGEPLKMSQSASINPPSHSLNADTHEMKVQKLAFEVFSRIIKVTPITATSLVTLTMLDAGHRTLTLTEVHSQVAELLDWVAKRNLPTTDHLQLDEAADVQRTLDELTANGVVTVYDAGPELVFLIDPEQHLTAAYYRNTIIQGFVNDAIGELAMLKATDADQGQAGEVFHNEIMALRDLLKKEFYFSEKSIYAQEVEQSISMRAPGWSSNGDVEGSAIREILHQMRPLLGHRVLRSFIDSYIVVAQTLLASDPEKAIDDKSFIKDCLTLGQQMLLQRRIVSEESISKASYGNGLSLAKNRGLFDGAPEEIASARRDFAIEMHDVSRRIEAIHALAASRHTGILN
jgi:glycerol-3-phosphate O-acyltransferase